MVPSDRNKPMSLANTPTLAAESGNGQGLVPLPNPPAPYTDQAPGGPPGLTAAPTLSALLQGFRRRWLLAVGMGVGGAVLALAVIWFVMPAKYTAQSRLKVTSRPSGPVFIQRTQDEVDAVTWRANQIAIIKSPLVLSSALNSEKLKKMGVSGESTETLETDLKVDYTLGPEIMRISLSGDNPVEVAAVVNAVVDAYLKELDSQENSRRTALLDQLTKSRQTYVELLDSKRRDLAKRLQDLGLDDPETAKARFNVAIQRYLKMDEEFRSFKNDLTRKESELAYSIKREPQIEKEPVSQAALEKYLKDSDLLKSGRKQMEEVEDTISKTILYSKLGKDDPSLPALYERKQSIKASLDQQIRQLQPEIEKYVRADEQAALRGEIGKLKIAIEAARSQEKDRMEALAELDRDVKRLDPANRPRPLDVEKLRDDVVQTEKALERINTEVGSLKMEPTLASRIIRLQPAEEPRDRDYARQGRVALIAALAMFCLMLGAVAFWETRSRRINDGQEIVSGLGLGLVGTLPILPPEARKLRPGQGNSREIQWQNLLTESVDSLRTLLLHGARQNALQVVMVTSASSGEGKTSLASQLATSLARAWRKTLLIDGDLRNPAAHKLFDLPLEPGFSEVLRGEASLDEAIRPTALGRLWLMSAGNLDAHAAQALAQDGVKALFDQLKQQYDFIVIDSSPVLPVADTLLLGQHVDGVLLSVLRDVSRLPQVHAANQRLQAMGIRTLGAVVIGGETESTPYGYGLNKAAVAGR